MGHPGQSRLLVWAVAMTHVTHVVHKPPPSADEQLSFLSKVQRLFGEGDFTATYKCALLISHCAYRRPKHDFRSLPASSTGRRP